MHQERNQLMRAMRESGKPLAEIAAAFHVSMSATSIICRGIGERQPSVSALCPKCGGCMTTGANQCHNCKMEEQCGSEIRKPCKPTTAYPGTPEKFRVLCERFAAGEELWHDDDPCDYNGAVGIVQPSRVSHERGFPKWQQVKMMEPVSEGE